MVSLLLRLFISDLLKGLMVLLSDLLNMFYLPTGFDLWGGWMHFSR